MRRRTALAAILLALIVAGGVGVVLQRKHIAPAPPALPRPVASVILDDTARPKSFRHDTGTGASHEGARRQPGPL